VFRTLQTRLLRNEQTLRAGITPRGRQHRTHKWPCYMYFATLNSLSEDRAVGSHSYGTLKHCQQLLWHFTRVYPHYSSSQREWSWRSLRCYTCDSWNVKPCNLVETHRPSKQIKITSQTVYMSRAVALAVSRLLPTAATRVRARARSCGICGGQSGTGAGFLRILQFPLPLIPPTAPHSSSSIIRGWYCRTVVADKPSGRSLTPPPKL
jgi:hypothetical protein